MRYLFLHWFGTSLLTCKLILFISTILPNACITTSPSSFLTSWLVRPHLSISLISEKVKQERPSRLMLPHEICKLTVLSVQLNDAYPVLDFLQKTHDISWEGALHHREINSRRNSLWLSKNVIFQTSSNAVFGEEELLHKPGAV